MNNATAIQLNKGEGSSFWVLGDLYTFKLTGEQSNGAYTVMEQIIQPQGGPPPHIHHREDEIFYVLEGRFSFLCETKVTTYETGSFVYIPKGTLHTFKNIDSQQGKLLVTITPAGLEEFFYAIGTPATDSDAPPAFDPGIIEKLMQLSKDYHMDIVMDNQ